MQLLNSKSKKISIALFFLLNIPSLVFSKVQTDSLSVHQYLEKAEKLNENAKYDSALFYAKKASTVYKEIKDWELYIRTLNTTAESYLAIAEYDTAKIILELALDVGLREINPKSLTLAKTYNEVGVWSIYTGDYEKALKYFEKAMGIQIELIGEEHEETLTTFNNIGVCLENTAKYEKAIEFYSKVLELSNNDNPPLIAAIHNNIGRSMENIGMYDKALFHHNESLKISLSIYTENHPYIAIIYNNIGMVWEKKKEFAEAIKSYEKAKGIAERLLGQYHPISLNIDNNTATVLKRKGDNEAALNFYLKTVNPMTKVYGEFHPNMSIIYNNIGECLNEANEKENALEYHKKAVKACLITLNKKHPNLAMSYLYLGKLYEGKGDFLESLSYYQQAISSLTENYDNSNFLSNPKINGINSKPYLLNVLNHKANALKAYSKKEKEKNKYLQASLDTYETASQLIDSLRFELGQENIRSLNEYYITTYEGGTNVAYELFKNTNDSTYLHKIFEFTEKSKAFFLQKALRESNAKSFANIPDSLTLLEKDLKIEQSFYRKKLVEAQSQNDSSKIVLYRSYLFDKRKKFDSLIALIEDSYPKYYQLKYQIATPKIHQIQRSLQDSNSFVLEFFVSNKDIFLFTIGKNNFTLTSINNNDFIINRSISSLRDAISKYNKDHYEAFRRHAYLLYEKLIQPVSSFIQPKQTAKTPKLIIIPDGQLHYLPFELLLTKDDNPTNNYKDLPYLIHDFSISYHLSANLWIDSEPSIAENTAQCLAFAPTYDVSSFTDSINNSDNDKPLTNLSGTVREVEEISNIVTGNFFLGKEATESNFKKNASKYQVLHLAMHGLVDDKYPENSKLIFTSSNDSIQDNSLHVYEIYTMNIPSDLVVLSACQTGEGQLEQGEGILSLSRAFMYAGSPSLIMSLWKVGDQQTAILMKYFYEALDEGLDKDDALRFAKLKYLSFADANTAHPFFWASFVPIGNISSVEFKHSTNLVWWLGAILLLSGISIAFWKKKKD